MSHLTLVSNEAPAVPYGWSNTDLEETPPPIPREAIASGAIDSVFGDLFTPQRQTNKTPVKKAPTPTIEEITGMLPPAILNRMREAMTVTPPPMPREAGHIPFEYSGRTRRRFTRTRNDNPRIISARFPSTCSETDNRIETGEDILWNPLTKQVWCADSDTFKAFQRGEQ